MAAPMVGPFWSPAYLSATPMAAPVSGPAVSPRSSLLLPVVFSQALHPAKRLSAKHSNPSAVLGAIATSLLPCVAFSQALHLSMVPSPGLSVFLHAAVCIPASLSSLLLVHCCSNRHQALLINK